MLTNAKHLVGLLLAVLAIVAGSSPAAAHTGFESSSPSEGDVVAEPVSEITLTFTGEATPAGEGFVVLDPTGEIRIPDEVTTSDNLTWVITFDEPLAGGDVGVRWMVAATDAHPIDGSFSFTVTAPAQPSTDTSDAPESDDVVAADDAAEPGDPEESSDGADSPPPSTAPESAGTEPVGRVGSGESAPPTTSSEPVDLQSFLDTDSTAPAAVEAIAAVARILNILGAVLVIGGAAFAAVGLRGDPNDVRAVLAWVRRGGAVLIVAAAAQAVTTTVTLAGEWSALTSGGDLGDALWSSTGLAIALRALGGLVTVSKTAVHTSPAHAVADPVVAARQLATVGSGHSAPSASERESAEPFVYAEDHAWDPRAALGPLVGATLIATSFIFDGHTASEGPRWLHAVANLTHVTTAAIWAGGVAMLAATIWRRHRDDRPANALQLAMRFSVIATIALVVAALAGLALSVVVLDSISQLWATPWGRLILLKVALVACAAAGGAYNHRVIVPALDRQPDHQPTIDRFRSVVTFEAGALLTVAITTAFLVAASST